MFQEVQPICIVLALHGKALDCAAREVVAAVTQVRPLQRLNEVLHV